MTVYSSTSGAAAAGAGGSSGANTNTTNTPSLSRASSAGTSRMGSSASSSASSAHSSCGAASTLRDAQILLQVAAYGHQQHRERLQQDIPASTTDDTDSPQQQARFIYSLIPRQQPVHSRMCGFGEKVDRRPVDPPPVIQLQITAETSQGRQNNIQMMYGPYYFMYASLMSPDGQEELNILRDGKTRSTIGSIVSSLFRLKDIDDSDGVFFVFPDLSVRMDGDYRFKFSLFEIKGSRLRFCQSIVSDVFHVYTAKRFPGMTESTALSRKFSEQGLKIRSRKEISNRRFMKRFENSSSGPLSSSSSAPPTSFPEPVAKAPRLSGTSPTSASSSSFAPAAYPYGHPDRPIQSLMPPTQPQIPAVDNGSRGRNDQGVKATGISGQVYPPRDQYPPQPTSSCPPQNPQANSRQPSSGPPNYPPNHRHHPYYPPLQRQPEGGVPPGYPGATHYRGPAAGHHDNRLNYYNQHPTHPHHQPYSSHGPPNTSSYQHPGYGGNGGPPGQPYPGREASYDPYYHYRPPASYPPVPGGSGYGDPSAPPGYYPFHPHHAPGYPSPHHPSNSGHHPPPSGYNHPSSTGYGGGNGGYPSYGAPYGAPPPGSMMVVGPPTGRGRPIELAPVVTQPPSASPSTASSASLASGGNGGTRPLKIDTSVSPPPPLSAIKTVPSSPGTDGNRFQFPMILASPNGSVSIVPRAPIKPAPSGTANSQSLQKLVDVVSGILRRDDDGSANA